MAKHERFSKCLEPTAKCHERDCVRDISHIGGMYYADNDVIYCYYHVIGHINIWRVTSCEYCKDQIEQTGNVCNKCGKPL